MQRTPLKLLLGVAIVALSLMILSGSVASGFWRDAPIPAVEILPQPTAARALALQPSQDSAVFAGGCFWGVEAVFEHMVGVTSAVVGYAGGSGESPTYQQVSSGRTGHAEAVRVVYDPSQVTYAQLLHVFFAVAHDPTQLNRQGPDVGTQYRSAIFYGSAAEKREAEAYVAQLTRGGAFARPIVTQIVPLDEFHEAEQYHQDYLVRHPNQPYIVINDAPKLEHLRTKFPSLYRKPAHN
jgi:peptide-methionine (S)-S-oxide reductase